MILSHKCTLVGSNRVCSLTSTTHLLAIIIYCMGYCQ